MNGRMCQRTFFSSCNRLSLHRKECTQWMIWKSLTLFIYLILCCHQLWKDDKSKGNPLTLMKKYWVNEQTVMSYNIKPTDNADLPYIKLELCSETQYSYTSPTQFLKSEINAGNHLFLHLLWKKKTILHSRINYFLCLVRVIRPKNELLLTLKF